MLSLSFEYKIKFLNLFPGAVSYCLFIYDQIQIYINEKIAYCNQDITTEIPNCTRNYVIIPDTVKIPFNLDKSM